MTQIRCPQVMGRKRGREGAPRENMSKPGVNGVELENIHIHAVTVFTVCMRVIRLLDGMTIMPGTPTPGTYSKD